MVGVDSIIKFPEFQGDESEDPEKHLFICENIWEAKQVTKRIQKSCSYI
jgi:hypothetical protein